MSNYHTPVLMEEAIEGLQVAPGKRFIDATVGGGGHAFEIVRRGGELLGIDADAEAVQEAHETLKRDHVTATIIQGNFRDIGRIAKDHGFESADGILFDLGVSSHQLNAADRGFSYRFPKSPLDLRLNQGSGQSAADYLQTVGENELYETLAAFSEEELSRPISHAIIRARAISPVSTTGALYNIIESVVGKRQASSVASRIFQALRIAVNDELTALKEGLVGAQALLVPGGRLVVISFHSLEDRIVKLFLKNDAWKVITKKPIVATSEEIATNIRSRSAKLRIAQKL